MSTVLKVFAPALVVASFFISSVAAAESSPQHRCSEVVRAAERLACYDKEFPPGPGAESSEADLEARRLKGLEEFGLNRTQLRSKSPDMMQDVAPERVQGVVARVGVNATGKRVVTLVNGHAWLLTEGTSKGTLKSGDKVVIREAALSTYMLITPGGVALRARRIQ